MNPNYSTFYVDPSMLAMGSYAMQASPSVYSTGSSNGAGSGNNPFGSTGTIKCETCRTRRKKVVTLSLISN